MKIADLFLESVIMDTEKYCPDCKGELSEDGLCDNCDG